MKLVALNTEKANLSEEQFFNLCVSNSLLHIERDKHQNIIIMAPTGTIGGNRNLKICTELEIWNRKKNTGITFDSSSGFRLPNGAMRAPDAAWITVKRWNKVPREEQEVFAPICPDFIIEVRSKSDTLKQQKEKMEDWMENGCRLAWLVDPYSRNTLVYLPDAKPTKHPFSETLLGGEVLPGFELKLDDIIQP